ncbi:hypothetical protein HDF26_002171 [Pedobacter cryoconitis]|uniref:Outer membrane protein beta-barrel domain-containing protein n=1 Tax=Pedobacter cryoconitis TaxID=188932 RepID=A0A7W8ZJL8_9SPHI|nr:outer membrane beta-barrel family protein [Pedobacter cryoconitis]MBB5635102.1 hypothetical protein [Pedobacter cryoconitis]MBB6271714.1 hypothetical protein [Pedobacter cryoconitis]
MIFKLYKMPDFFKLLLFLFFFPLALHAQYKVSGIIKDQEGKPINGVNIFLTSDASDFQTISTLTDELGKFSLMGNKGVYVVKISQLNFKQQQISINLTSDTVLAAITLENDSKNLKEVVITGKKAVIEYKLDRYVFNVDQSVTAMGNDGMETLRKTPGVRISDDAISLAGKGAVKVMVNDRLISLSGKDLTNYLQSLRSEDISNIEVITSPSAKYDAQGNSGLININLKKNKKEDFSGDVSLGYTQASHPGANVGAGLNYKKDKFSATSTLRVGDGSVNQDNQEKIFYSDYLRSSSQKTRNYNKYISGRISLDYQFSDRAIAGIQYAGNSSAPDSKDDILVNFINPSTKAVAGTINTTGKTDSKVNYNNLSAFYQLKLDTSGKRLSLGTDYFAYKSDRNRFFNSYGTADPGVQLPIDIAPTDANNWGNQNMKIYTANVDLTLPYKWARLEFGGKLSFIKNKNDIGFRNLTVDTTQNDVFSYNENIQALYGTVQKKLSDQWDAKVGLRFESTHTKGISASLNQTNNNTYNSFFPSAYISYSPQADHKFTANYNRRINRPSYEALNPFRWYASVFSYSAGNPFLRPEIINNVEVSHVYKDKLSTKLYASKTSNWFERVTFISPDNSLQAYIYENYATFYNAGLTESYSFSVGDRWESNNEASAYYNYSDIQLDVLVGKTKGMSGYVSTNNSFTLNAARTIFAEVNYMYQFPAPITQYQLSNFHQLDIGFKFQFLNNKLRLGVNGSDVFKTGAPTIVGYTNNIRQEYKNYADLRRVVFSINYRFGSDKVKPRQKDAGNKAETGRAL